MSYRTAALILAALAAAPAAAQPGGTITASGFSYNAHFSEGAAPMSETDDFNPTNTFFGPSSNNSQLFGNWWYYRVQGDPRERPFGTYSKSDGSLISGTSTYPANGNGNSATYHWTELGTAGTRFNATYNLLISGGPTNPDSRLDQTFQITNPNSTALNLVLFNVADMAPVFYYFNAVVGYGNVSAISVSDGTYQVTHSAVGASAYRVAPASTLYGEMVDSSVNNLNNSGLPFSGAIQGDAFQWNLSIPANSSVIITSAFTTSVGVPEPGTALLTGAGAAGMAVLRLVRRRTLQAIFDGIGVPPV